MYTELLIGCGSTRDKRLCMDGHKDWSNLITLDNNSDHKPDILHDLNIFPLPFYDEAFDEIHAYEVLEHLGGGPGDYEAFFLLFSELHRILKPNGLLLATVPHWKSMWAWGDPSHRRVINEGTLVFLSQREYAKQVGKTAMSDFRYLYKADFETQHMAVEGDSFQFVLKALK